MSSADLWEDGYPHGTVEGFDGGCRGGACPADAEIGMSCKRAKALAAGDFRYNRLVAAGKTPAEIAAIIDGRDTPAEAPASKPAPKRKPKATPPADVEAPEPITETPAEVSIAGSATTATTSAGPTEQTQSTTPTPKEDAMPAQPLTTDKFTAGLNQRARTFVLRSIREWARANGFPGVPTHGKIPQDALAAFDQAHPNGIIAGGIAEPKTTPAGVAEHVAQLRAIREWARENGWPDIADRGPVSDEIRDAYDAAHTVTIEPETVTPAPSDSDTDHPTIEYDEQTARDVLDHFLNLSTEEPEAPEGTDAAVLEEQAGGFFADIGDVRDRAGIPFADGGIIINGSVSFDEGDTPETYVPAPKPSTRFIPREVITPRPEWSQIAVNEDVERARELAVRLEAENALLLEQVAAAHRALEVVLVLHAERRDDNAALRLALSDAETQIAYLTYSAGLTAAHERLLTARITELEAAAKPWWKRTA